MLKLSPASKSIGLMVAESPSTQKMLKTFEPITFPIARSVLPFLTATTAVTSSGNDVPIATMVNPTEDSEYPNNSASETAPSTIYLQ